jgi:fructosamine-3-kinase
MRRKFERLFSILPELVGPEEPPARLHGDLWGGNALVGPEGEPCLIDPAVYGGHREVDLAMLRLFGDPGRQFFAAYEERFPLAPGHEGRVPLYQLFPLLVHAALFGGGYGASAERAARVYV